ncbi:uncharacterized protein DUF3306 [Cupriavidus gilardii J11]|uniref:Uncharacterized protein DUF3306 n=1 Tax=Cupriavidus gilardii J11 TaxID=936133 RepID=A0A562BMM7_9BURK|nr:DUF3306 domain-containing protein [Cupriavidus gilardii]TWG86464.1 uncharacterized protein DUF3306 [Cupriavidus gilardii J11]
MKSSRSSNAAPSADSADDGSFLSRWSRRKAAVREGRAVAPEPPAAPVTPVAAASRVAGQPPSPDRREAPPAPTLADVALLKPGEGISRFVARGVDEQVKRAALKTLFADPHFNVMDGLDIYIDDYTRPDPIPPEVLRRLNQSESLGLFAPREDEVHTQADAAAQGPDRDAGSEVGAEGAPDTATDPALNADAVDATDAAGSGADVAQAEATDAESGQATPGAPVPARDPDKPA